MCSFVLQYGGSVGSQPSPPTTEPGPVPSSPSQEPPTKREYDQCRIQVRLPDGTSLTQTFRAREQLAAVRLYVELHRGEEPGGCRVVWFHPQPFSFEGDCHLPRPHTVSPSVNKPLVSLFA